MCIKMCVSVSQSEAAQHKPKWASRGFGVWRVEVHLAGHFGGLGHSLVHAAVGCAVHGALGVGAAALVVGRVAAAAALVGMRAGAVALAGVGAGAVAIERGDAGAGGGTGTDQAGHAGRGH